MSIRFGKLTNKYSFLVDGKMRVTDPCYTPGTWCSYVLDNVQPGLWQCQGGLFIDEHDELRSKNQISRINKTIEKLKESFLDNQDRIDVAHNEWLVRDYERERARWEGESFRVGVLWAGIGVTRGEEFFRPLLVISELDEEEDTDTVKPYHHQGLVKVEKAHIGVDSGQAGFFDDNVYVNRYFNFVNPGKPVDKMDEAMYDIIGDGTCNDDGLDPVGVAKYSDQAEAFGIASLTGYGDGGYDLFVGESPTGQINEVMLLFV